MFHFYEEMPTTWGYPKVNMCIYLNCINDAMNGKSIFKILKKEMKEKKMFKIK